MTYREQSGTLIWPLLLSTGLHVVMGAAALVIVAVLLAIAWELHPVLYLAKATLAYLGLAAMILWFLPDHGRHERFGLPNGLTLIRGVLVCLLAGLIGEAPPAIQWPWQWWLAGAAAVALALDGLDGAVARRRGQDSPFGARFDMEVDALFILVLSAMVWDLGKTGPWILLAGGLRYLFVAAGFAWHRLARPLPPSRRRRVACAVQAGGLVICLAPGVTGVAAIGVASIALGALILSFAIDLAYLIADHETEGENR